MKRVTYIEFPKNKAVRILKLIKLLPFMLLHPIVSFRALNFRKLGRGVFSFVFIFWSIPIVTKMKKYDVVHCHFGMVANKFLIIKDILGLKQKFITTFYGQDSSKYIQSKGLKVYDRLKEESRYILVMTEEMKERFIRLGFPPSKLIVHYTGVAPENYVFSEKDYDSSKIFEIISVGRFVEKKGFDDLIRSAKLIKKRGANFRVHIIGGGGNLDYKQRIFNLVNDLGLKELVIFEGLKPHRETLNMFCKMHLVVQLSKRAADGDTDDLPFVLLEGQASGLPVVSTNHVGIPEGILDGRSGFIVQEGDFRAAADRILYLINNPRVLKEFSREAHKFVTNKFNLHKLNKRLVSIYKELSVQSYV